MTTPQSSIAHVLLATACALLCGGVASAEPLDLANPEPRAVQVRFETSPADRPAQTRTRYSPPLPGRLSPGPGLGAVTVTIDGGLVERHLMVGQDPVPGSFSDFVWVFDTATGDVRSATVSGVVHRKLRVGLSSFRMRVPIRVRMDTDRPAGLEGPLSLFGLTLHPFCRPGHGGSCHPVEPARYDPATGYVHAVGPLVADSSLVRVRTFSPLGEALFDESEAAGQLAGDAPPVSLGPPAAAAALN